MFRGRTAHIFFPLRRGRCDKCWWITRETKHRPKRGGDEWQRVTLKEIGDGADSEQINILTIQEALERLATFDPKKAEIIDLMVFGGVTGKDIAGLMGISEDAVWREWRMARAWLRNELKSIHA